jgi:NitT/TauT family transport system substrate-binding protein
MRGAPARARRGLPGGLLLAAGLLAVAGCHVSGTSSAAPKVFATVTVAAPPGVADAPLYLGAASGLFRHTGLRLRIRSYSSVPAEVSALAHGFAQIGFGDYADLFYASEQQPSVGLQVVADGYDCGANTVEVVALPGSGITSPQDLAGKAVGTPAPEEMPTVSPAHQAQPYSLETVATWAALSNDNVDPARIHWDPMPASGLIPALKIGAVQAILVTQPAIIEAETQLGVTSVLDSCSGPTSGLPLDGYFTTRAFARGHRAVLAAFRAALAKAQAEAATAAPLQGPLEHDAGLDRQTAALVTTGTYPTTLNPAALQRVASLMFSYNMLPAPLSVSRMIAR